MNDTINTDKPKPDWMAQANAYAERQKAIFPDNRSAIFDAMERHGIDTVILAFDGSGDSGQIENVTAAPDTAADLASVEVMQKRARWDSGEIDSVSLDLRAALEDLAYELLEDTHDGWEIKEGAYGEFTFDVGSRAIALDYNQRIETSEYSRHEF